MQAQNLLLDADDTLWESNIYFERVIEEFLDRLDHSGKSREEMRRIVNGIEHAHLATRGYGAKPFGLNLIDAFQELTELPVDDTMRRWIEDRVAGIENQAIELLDGVVETLAYLAERHLLVLLTKGEAAEQSRKLERSGVGGYFNAVEVVREKDTQTYLSILGKHRFDISRTWMIGNSPKSDINPALAAGLRAILIPHDRTWILEHENLPADPERFLIIDRFARLRQIF